MMPTRQITRAFAALALAVASVACGGGSTDTVPKAPEAPVTNPVDPATAGSVSGHVTFSGQAPAAAPISMASDPRCPNAGAVAEALVGANGSLQNAFVYVRDGLGNLKFPVPTAPVVLDQNGCQYRPHVFGAQVGQGIEILNSDPTLHNIHARPMTNQEFNVGQGPQGLRATHVFNTREVMVPFKCDVHKWMNAYVGVLDHPFYSVTGADGAFALKGLPPGTYTIEVWHEKLGTQTQTVTVAAREAKDVAFAFAG